ncbi:hypothetical protein ILFOPFJJ_06572 [Ensifer psoraleae]|nr:hypothetical protein [Sinorhizobium psoraleae]NRP75649.1 hypothetical protein [Sinorhizobium psoraleae]
MDFEAILAVGAAAFILAASIFVAPQVDRIVEHTPVASMAR